MFGPMDADNQRKTLTVYTVYGTVQPLLKSNYSMVCMLYYL